MKTKHFSLKKAIICLIISINSFSLIFAQSTGEIKGKIIDDATEETLPGASIYVEYGGKLIGTNSDIDGNFTLKPLTPGTYNLNVSFTGYEKIVITSIDVKPDKITFLNNIRLSPGMTLTTTVIDGGKSVKLIDPEDPSKISMLGSKIEKIPGKNSLPMLLRCMTSDVMVSDNDKELYFRGSRSGSAVYYIDGIKSRDSEMGIPGSAIGSITVYTGGVPAKYGDFVGGCVVIETKSYYDWLNEMKARQYR